MSVRDVFHMAVVNRIADFTLAADATAETGYPLTNLQNQNANEPTVFDMAAETSVTIEGTGATEYIVNCLSIWNHNMPVGNTVQLLLYPEESYGGTPYDTGAIAAQNTIPWAASVPADPWGGSFESISNLKTCFMLFFDEFNFKSFKIVIQAPTSTDDALSIDKIWLAPAYPFDYGYMHGSRFGIKDNSEHQRKPGGGMETVEFECYRYMQLDFQGMTNAETILVENLFDRAKKSGDLLISCDPNNTRGMKFKRSGIFRRTNDSDFTSAYYNGSSMGLALEEN